jgi:hypothetical protein
LVDLLWENCLGWVRQKTGLHSTHGNIVYNIEKVNYN